MKSLTYFAHDFAIYYLYFFGEDDQIVVDLAFSLKVFILFF